MNPNRLAVFGDTPLWPPNGNGARSLPPIKVAIDEGYFEHYPRPVVDLITLDTLQGHWLRLLVDRLVAEGMPREQAKALIYPRAPGSSFKDVFDFARALITLVKMGGGGFRWTKEFERFERLLSLYQVLLGMSTTNGGGPGIMMLTSAALMNAISLLKRTKRRFERMSESELMQVLLQIGAETPNLLGKKEFRVWAIDSLKTRTAMLLSLGIVLGVMFYPGGFGTGEELLRTLVDDQLYGQIVTSLIRRVPIFIIDFDANSRAARHRADRWSTELRRIAVKMQRWGCIGKETLAERTHVIDVADPEAPKKVMLIMDAAAKQENILGFSLIEKWQQDNGADFFVTAESLLPELETNFSLPAPPNGKHL